MTMKDKFQTAISNNPWIVEHSLPVTSISNEDISVFMHFSNQLSFLKEELHPVFLKMIYQMRYWMLKQRMEYDQYNSILAIIYAEQLASLPKDLLTKEDSDFIIDMAIRKLIS
jgi:hypothetical protein